MILKIVRIAASKIVQGASDPATRIMGKGHIRIKAPEFVDPSENVAAIIKITTPEKIVRNPKISNIMYLLSMPSSSFVCSENLPHVIVAFSTYFDTR